MPAPDRDYERRGRGPESPGLENCAPPMSAPTAFTTAHPEAAALPCRKEDGYADSTPPGAHAITWREHVRMSR